MFLPATNYLVGQRVITGDNRGASHFEPAVSALCEENDVHLCPMRHILTYHSLANGQSASTEINSFCP